MPFAARDMISTQFIMTPRGWKISAMAWDDERPGLVIPNRYGPTERADCDTRRRSDTVPPHPSFQLTACGVR